MRQLGAVILRMIILRSMQTTVRNTVKIWKKRREEMDDKLNDVLIKSGDIDRGTALYPRFQQ